MSLKNELAILVVGCNKNKWLLRIFINLFRENWRQCPCDLYLSLEDMDYDLAKEITVLNVGKTTTWCERVKKSLDFIRQDYVLILLDDFLIEEKVDEDTLQNYVLMMKELKAYNLILTTVPNEKNTNLCNKNKWAHRDRFGRYKTSLQCGIWKKSVLHDLLRENENPWEFELFGNIRSFLYEDSFYALKEKEYKPIKYNEGLFMVQGKINSKELDRIETKLGYRLNIPPDIKRWEEVVIRDNIKFVPRVIRRFKIILYYWLYRMKYIGKRKWLKNV